MSWNIPPDPQYAFFGHVPALLSAALVVLLGLFLLEWRRGKLMVGGRGVVALVGGLTVSVAIFVALVDLLSLGTPSWDIALEHSLAGLHALYPLAVAASFPFALAASFAVFVWAVLRGRWKEAYFALAAGPGLGALLVAFKLAYPRLPPSAQPFFEGPTAFIDDGAALWTMTLLVLAFLYPRVASKRIPLLFVAAAAVLASAAVLAGTAWLSDALGGLIVALAWFCACRMGLHIADGKPAGLAHRVGDFIDGSMARILARPAPWLLGIIGLGVALRIASYWTTPLAVDSFSYAVLGRSLLATGDLTMPWGDVDTFHTAAVASHHYPPLYPMYLAAFYKVLGFTQSATRIAAIVSSLGALLVTYYCTRDLYGKRRALVATAIIAVSPILVQNTGQGYSENLVLLLFVATLWAILKSLDKPWFIVAAGLLAGLGYLAKSSMGYFFIIAGLGGLGWRLRWRGWKVMRDPSYLLAVAVFGSMVIAWANRNYLLFGSWETSAHLSEAYSFALTHPFSWGYLTLVTTVFYATIGYLLLLAILPWLPRLVRIPRLESEHDSGLWLALGLPLLLTSAIDAALWLVEKEFFLNNARYVAFVMVPAMWLVTRHAHPRERGTRLAIAVTVLLLVTGSLYFAKPDSSFTQRMADDLAPRLAPGDSVGFVDNNNHYAYRFYFQFTDEGRIDRHVEIACVEHPLCPENALRAAQLNTTWVFAPDYASGIMEQHYHKVPGSITTSDGVHRESPQLWRHN